MPTLSQRVQQLVSDANARDYTTRDLIDGNIMFVPDQDLIDRCNELTNAEYDELCEAAALTSHEREG